MANVDGVISRTADAHIPVMDRGFLYGDSIYEVFRTYGGVPLFYDEHWARFENSASLIRMQLGLTQEQMTREIQQTVLMTNAAECGRDVYVRYTMTRGEGAVDLFPSPALTARYVIIVKELHHWREELYSQGVRLAIPEVLRNSISALNPNIKGGNYLNNILAKIEGTDAGFVEALMLNHRGEVAECTGDNIFIVKSGIVKTPSADAGILEGITRNAVIRLAREAGTTVQEVVLTRHDIFTADECFLTGTAAEVIAVISLDGRIVGSGKPGPITRELMQKFRELTREK